MMDKYWSNFEDPDLMNEIASELYDERFIDKIKTMWYNIYHKIRRFL